MRTCLMLGVLGLAVLSSWLSCGVVVGQTATPEIRSIDIVNENGEIIILTRAELGNTGTYVGAALICSKGDPDGPKVSVFLGGFPPDRRAVQLAVRRVDGGVERFGPVMRGGAHSGFHSPELYEVDEAERFVRAAFVQGALVSNGYNSFWNRISDVRNSEVQAATFRCWGQSQNN